MEVLSAKRVRQAEYLLQALKMYTLAKCAPLVSTQALKEYVSNVPRVGIQMQVKAKRLSMFAKLVARASIRMLAQVKHLHRCAKIVARASIQTQAKLKRLASYVRDVKVVNI